MLLSISISGSRLFRRVGAWAALSLALGLLAAPAAPAWAQRSPELKQWESDFESGRAALSSGNTTVAESFLRKAVAEALLLAPDPAKNLYLAQSYEAISRLHAEQEDYRAAEDYLNQAVAIRRAAQPPDHPDLGRALIRMADLQRRRGAYSQAERLYRDTIETIGAALGPGHILLAHAYYGLARTQMDQGRASSADGSLLQAFSILGQQESLVQRDNILDLRPFAEAYMNLNRPDDAERILRQGLDLYARHYAVDHPFYEGTLLQLGRMLLDRGDAAGAERVFDRGADEMVLAMGPGSERAAATIEKIAELFRTYAYPAKAETYYRRALAVRERSAGTTESDRVRGLVKLGDLYLNRGDAQGAESLYREAIDLAERRLAPDSVERAYANANLALILWDRGEVAEAERLWTEALKIYDEKIPGGDATVATVAFNLAQLKHGQGNYAAAEPLYQRSLEIRERILGPGAEPTLETINMYSLLLDRMGRTDEAARMRARAQ